MNGDRLRDLRVERGITVAELAGRVSRSPEHLKRAERGDRISDVLAARIALVLGVPVADFTRQEQQVA